MKSLKLAAAAICVTAGLSTPATVSAADTPFIGEITVVGFNFCPRNWAEANGQLLPIQQHTALFSLLGTFYGGDGRTTFALPDLRGRAPVHVGTGPGLPATTQGQQGGNAKVTRATGIESSANTQPTLTMRYCIALQGIYPSRN